MRNILYKSTFVFIALLLFGCNSDDDITIIPDDEVTTEVVDSVLVSATKSASLPSFVVRNLVNSSPLASFSNQIQYDIDIFRIEYTTHFFGEEITVSGLLCIPKGEGPFPIVSAHHGTIVKENSAPSHYSAITNAASSESYELLASAGFITIVPDYIGYGASSSFFHPYYHAELTTNATIDGIKAAKEYASLNNIQENEQLFLIGYSEGGYVTLATQRAIENSPNLDWTITASAAGAGAYNLRGVMSSILQEEIYTTPHYIAFVAQSYNTSNNWNNPLTDYFNEPFASSLPELFNGINGAGVINANLNDTLSVLVHPSFLTDLRTGTEGQFLEELERNSVNNWTPIAPLRMYHGDADNIVPFSDSQETYTNFLLNGATNVTFTSIPDGTHTTAIEPMIVDVIPWFLSLVEK